MAASPALLSDMPAMKLDAEMPPSGIVAAMAPAKGSQTIIQVSKIFRRRRISYTDKCILEWFGASPNNREQFA